MMTSAEEEFAWRCRKCCSLEIATIVTCLCLAKKERAVFFSASLRSDSSCPLSPILWVKWEAVGLRLAVGAEGRMELEKSCLDSSVGERVLKNSSQRLWPLPGEKGLKNR